MIGTFWNLCRACPSMPIDKSRSEYRSTYQWYEYTGGRQEVVKQAPQLTSPTRPEENGIQATLINVNKNEGTKRLKENIDGNAQPEVNIKRNPIYGKKDIDFSSAELDNNVADKIPEHTAVRVRSRNDRRDYTPSRRSKSEGPPGTSNKRSYYATYGYPSSDFVEPSTDFHSEYVLISNCPEDYDTETAGIPVKGSRGNTEYRLQFAWPKSKNETQEELKAAGGGSRRSVFMAPTGYERPPVPVHKKRFLDADKKDGGPELEPLVDQNGECETITESKDNKIQINDSEYKKKFRPFSQYDYVAGKFLARDSSVTPSSSPSNASWYTEVIELRKKAGEYKHRGWGTELVPQHLAEVYNKQIALWEHVSRRSSLSALTLATTTQKPRALTKEEKSKENSRKLIPHKLRDSYRQASVDRAASALRKKTEKNEEIKRHSAKVHRDTSGKSTEKPSSSAGTPTSTSISSGRSQPTATISGSPKKHSSTRPVSSGSPKKTVANHEAYARPTTLATNAHSRIKRDASASAKKRETLKPKISPVSAKAADESAKRSVQVAKKTAGEEAKAEGESEANEKGAEDNIDVEHIVKSPPEPTRVKSPEQLMMRSPEPVNWTVPLDTGKTFTVTQNIQDGDLYHHRPPSEAKILSTLHHGTSQPADNQSITSLKSQDDATPPLSLESYPEQLADKPADHPSLESTDKKSITDSCFAEDHPSSDPHQATNGKHLDSIQVTDEKSSPMSDPSDSNVKSSDLDSIRSTAPAPAVTGLPPDVMDSARDRFEQFWGKPKYEVNGKDSSM